jgi:precorrin-3B methylase
MQQNYPFQPRGSAVGSVSLAVTASAQAMGLPVLAQEGGSVRLVNVGTQPVYIAFTGTATVANSMPILANTERTFSIPPGTTAISAIAGATGSTLYATVGDGI